MNVEPSKKNEGFNKLINNKLNAVCVFVPTVTNSNQGA